MLCVTRPALNSALVTASYLDPYCGLQAMAPAMCDAASFGGLCPSKPAWAVDGPPPDQCIRKPSCTLSLDPTLCVSEPELSASALEYPEGFGHEWEDHPSANISPGFGNEATIQDICMDMDLNSYLCGSTFNHNVPKVDAIIADSVDHTTPALEVSSEEQEGSHVVLEATPPSIPTVARVSRTRRPVKSLPKATAVARKKLAAERPIPPSSPEPALLIAPTSVTPPPSLPILSSPRASSRKRERVVEPVDLPRASKRSRPFLALSSPPSQVRAISHRTVQPRRVTRATSASYGESSKQRSSPCPKANQDLDYYQDTSMGSKSDGSGDFDELEADSLDGAECRSVSDAHELVRLFQSGTRAPTRKEPRCVVCRENFSRPSDLLRHCKEVKAHYDAFVQQHPSMGSHPKVFFQERLPCHQCKKTFSRQDALVRHWRTKGVVCRPEA
ncbi:hypothetical protein FB451DRAFT_1523139 [Mycena latifolia]|nr:hypothetical protein FB451DRAFT_1523139 [Mycena latifolia]